LGLRGFKRKVQRKSKQDYMSKIFFENDANHERTTANKAAPERPKTCDMASYTG
jgi:hypothetical protein